MMRDWSKKAVHQENLNCLSALKTNFKEHLSSNQVLSGFPDVVGFENKIGIVQLIQLHTMVTLLTSIL
jgi:hypothetical protein